MPILIFNAVKRKLFLEENEREIELKYEYISVWFIETASRGGIR